MALIVSMACSDELNVSDLVWLFFFFSKSSIHITLQTVIYPIPL